MWTSITPALIGLLGVLVGAIISTGTNYLLAERKETAEAAKEKLSRAIELRTAARLIADELLTGRAAVTILIEKKRWVPAEIKLPLDAWERDKRIIAREFSFDDWSAVRLAAMAVEHFRSLSVGPRDENASEVTAEKAKSVLIDIEAGLQALQPYLSRELHWVTTEQPH